MKFKKRGYLIIIPMVGIIIFTYYRNTYIEFEPTLFMDDSYKTINVDSLFYKNLKIVFNYNNVQYKIGEQGTLLVKRKLNGDKELVFNYTQKALDTIWLNSHFPPNWSK